MKKNCFSCYNPWFAFLILVGLALVAAYPLLTETWFISHENAHLPERVIAVAEEMRHGDFYPRWLSVSHHGKGSPFFNFYSPAFYLVAGLFFVAGLPLTIAMKATAVLLFLAGAWGMYVWCRPHYGGAGGVVAAILYLFVPYHFVDIYVRGAMAEFGALAVLPYVFHGIDLALDREEHAARALLVTGLASAGLLLFHNLSALMAVPFAVVYGLFRCWQAQVPLRRMGVAMAGACAGVCLSAFYWLPVLAERRFLGKLETVTSGYGDYKLHFVYPHQFFSTYWGFGGSWPGTDDKMSYQIGMVVVLFVLTSIVISLASRAGSKQFVWLTVALGVGGLCMALELSLPVYRLASWLAYVQFPWRFLGVGTLFLAAAGGGASAGPMRPSFRWALVLTAAAASILASCEQRSVVPQKVADVDTYAETVLGKRLFGSMCNNDEYLPRWVSPGTAGFVPEIQPNVAGGAVSELKISGKNMSFLVDAPESGGRAYFPWHYFPGWRATVDGKADVVTPSADGYVSLALPPGRHAVRLSFGSTWPRMTGWGIAGSTLLALSGWSLLERKRRFPPACARSVKAVDSLHMP
jgi:6-pyruvoyl-tetrahydropterin synthase-like protein